MLAESRPELLAVRDELGAMKLLSAQKTRRRPARVEHSAAQPRRYVSASGLEILVGRNARQNEIVTFKMARSGDLWLHARGVPGSHVVVRTLGQEVDEETVRAGAQLAAFYSKLRGEHAAEVIVTQRRDVSRLRGGRRGQVRVHGDTTVVVAGGNARRRQSGSVMHDGRGVETSPARTGTSPITGPLRSVPGTRRPPALKNRCRYRHGVHDAFGVPSVLGPLSRCFRSAHLEARAAPATSRGGRPQHVPKIPPEGQVVVA